MTTRGATPWASSRLAALRRRSWNRSGGSPASTRSFRSFRPTVSPSNGPLPELFRYGSYPRAAYDSPSAVWVLHTLLEQGVARPFAQPKVLARSRRDGIGGTL